MASGLFTVAVTFIISFQVLGLLKDILWRSQLYLHLVGFCILFILFFKSALSFF